MAFFSSPLRYDWTYAEGAPRRDRRFWSYFGTQARGTTVIRTGGVWASVPNPTTDTTEAADLILFPDGHTKPAVLLGGHVTPITTDIATELTAQGYGDQVTL